VVTRVFRRLHAFASEC